MKILFTSTFIKTALISMITFIVLDLIWLAAIARKLYYENLSYLSAIKDGKIQFILPVGILVQAIIGLGLAVIITIALQVDNSLTNSIAVGAFTGFIMYCTYDLTNLSFIKGYPVFITIVDIAWGTFQGILSGFYVFYLFNYFNR